MIEFSPASVTHEGVNVGYREHFEAKLVKVNAKLAKIGAPPATIAFGPVVTRREVTEYGWEYDVQEFATVTITGVEARLAGWTPVAALDHTLAADEALVARFPAHFDTDIPDRFRFSGSVCDHCNIRIARNMTVLFSHEDGRWAQVGTTCILEYIGIDPATVLMLSTWNVRADEDEDGMGGPKGGRIYVAPIHFLAAAAEATRINGFRRADSDNPTKVAAADLAYGRIKPRDIEREFPGLDYGLGEAKALAVMAWVAESTDTGDFMTNARLACRADRVIDRTEGILACLPSVLDREMGKRAERAAKNVGGYLGEVGKKLIVTGTVTVASTFEGNYGMKRIVVVVDSDGNAVKTSGSGNSLWDAEVGDTVRFEGKVSAHSDTKYGPQTVVKMAKVFCVAADGTVLPSPTSNASAEHAYGDHDDAPTKFCYHCAKAAIETAVTA